MKPNYSGIALAWLVTTLLLLTACGGGGGSSSSGGTTYQISGQALKGPFAIGSQISVNELNASLSPTGQVYNVQTTDYLGNFTVSSGVSTNLVEIVGNGFYMNELTGQLSSAAISLRGIADLTVSTKPTVNALTTLQEQRLKSLMSQGISYSAAYTQSQSEVLAVFGINSANVNSLSTLYSMQINGNTDADSVLLATSVILAQMATDAATANGTTQPAEFSNLINTMASQLSAGGTVTSSTFITARNLAETEINLSAVRTNVETYYANYGMTMVAPKFEEWIDQIGSGILPQRISPVTGLTGVAYVANYSSNNISAFTINPTTGALASIGTFPTGINPYSITVDPTGKFVYAPNNGSSDISAYAINQSTGALTSIGTFPVGANPYFITFDLSGKFAYVTSNNQGNIYLFTKDTTTGALASVGTITVGTGTAPISMTIDPTGTYAYMVCATGNVNAYTIDSTSGSLTTIGTVAAGTNPSPIKVSPNGKFAYVANGGGNYHINDANVSAYTIDTTTGALTNKTTFAVSPTAGGADITVDTTGKFAFVTNYGTSNLSAYSINATTGALASIGTIPTGTNPNSIIVDPTGKFIYVTNAGSNNIWAYSINDTTGALAKIGLFWPGTNPTSIAFSSVFLN